MLKVVLGESINLMSTNFHSSIFKNESVNFSFLFVFFMFPVGMEENTDAVLTGLVG